MRLQMPQVSILRTLTPTDFHIKARHQLPTVAISGACNDGRWALHGSGAAGRIAASSTLLGGEWEGAAVEGTPMHS